MCAFYILLNSITTELYLVNFYLKNIKTNDQKLLHVKENQLIKDVSDEQSFFDLHSVSVDIGNPNNNDLVKAEKMHFRFDFCQRESIFSQDLQQVIFMVPLFVISNTDTKNTNYFFRSKLNINKIYKVDDKLTNKPIYSFNLLSEKGPVRSITLDDKEIYSENKAGKIGGSTYLIFYDERLGHFVLYVAALVTKGTEIDEEIRNRFYRNRLSSEGEGRGTLDKNSKFMLSLNIIDLIKGKVIKSKYGLTEKEGTIKLDLPKTNKIVSSCTLILELTKEYQGEKSFFEIKKTINDKSLKDNYISFDCNF
ncbi:hypothetical protein CDIK_1308 [Cucumispora dikerogammari]|nr:hypothetical protein CDIK_1308 [Cucumispora dikerogammari]